MLHRVIDEAFGGRSYFTKEEYKVKSNAILVEIDEETTCDDVTVVA